MPLGSKKEFGTSNYGGKGDESIDSTNKTSTSSNEGRSLKDEESNTKKQLYDNLSNDSSSPSNSGK